MRYPTPEGFLARYHEGAVFDEIQRAPDLVSYLQGMVDQDASAGRFILTGSQNLQISQSVSQSLAGRTALLQLLSCSWDEVQRFGRRPCSLLDVLWHGGYPRIHDVQIPADEWLASYVMTYLERDVRAVVNVGDLVCVPDFYSTVRWAQRSSVELERSRG